MSQPMLEQAIRPRLKMPTAPAPKRRPPGPVRRPILAKPAVTKQRKAAPGKPGTRQTATKLEQPAGKKQRKGACPKCEEATKSGKSAPCPTCNVSPELERPPVPSMKGMASDAHHPAERQADAIGARIGASLASVPSFGPGPLPDHARSVAEPHLGVSLAGTHLRADRGAQRKAASESALAVTEGRTVSFAAGQFSSSTSAGRALIGHELTHVGQQAESGRTLQRAAAQCGTVELCKPRWEGEPKLFRAPGGTKDPDTSCRPAVGVVQHRVNNFFDIFFGATYDTCMHPIRPRALDKNNQGERRIDLIANAPVPVVVDCWFGTDTTQAVKAFQAAVFENPTQWDGIVGKNTWSALNEFIQTGQCFFRRKGKEGERTHPGHLGHPAHHGAHPSPQILYCRTEHGVRPVQYWANFLLPWPFPGRYRHSYVNVVFYEGLPAGTPKKETWVVEGGPDKPHQWTLAGTNHGTYETKGKIMASAVLAGKYCEPLRRCFESVVAKYSGKVPYNSILGPNSNSFVEQLAHKCPNIAVRFTQRELQWDYWRHHKRPF